MYSIQFYKSMVTKPMVVHNKATVYNIDLLIVLIVLTGQQVIILTGQLFIIFSILEY